MGTYTIENLSQSIDHHKLYILMCHRDELTKYVTQLQMNKINAINIGKELASFIENLNTHSYLQLDVYDFLKKLLESQKNKVNKTGNELVAIYNLGILLEPALKLNAAQLLKEFSKTAALIIIWENQSEMPDRLHWPTQQNNVFLDFNETPLKKLQYAI